MSIAGASCSRLQVSSCAAAAGAAMHSISFLSTSLRREGWNVSFGNGSLPRSLFTRGSRRLYGATRLWARAASSSSPFSEQRKSSDLNLTPERLQKFNELVKEVVETAINTGPRGAFRLYQGIEAAASVGAEWLIELSRNMQKSRDSRFLQDWSPGPMQLRQLFERLGATYIKLGQFIASTPTLFPAEYVTEFQNCLDKTPSVPFSKIKAIIRQELGCPLEEVYEFVDEVPLASASVAQVHAARLRGSRKEVVIKVLKPGVEDILTTDLNFLYIAARVLEFLNPQLSSTSLVGIMADIRASILEEVDFCKEATNIESFRNYLNVMGLMDQAAAPFVYSHCSSRYVLTMERFFGVPLTDLNSLKSIVPNPEATLITALNVWFGSLVACETFHADVHAGNVLVLNDGRVGFIDFGIVGHISPSTWGALETFLTSIGSQDYFAMATSLRQMGATDYELDIAKFSKDLEKIFLSLQELDSDVLITAAGGPRSTTISAAIAIDEQQINALLLDVIRVSEAYGIRFPREFGLLLKQLLYFDRYTRLLAPDLNILKDKRIAIQHGRGVN
ncbi:hypothetical protein O6H91_12G076000 [Diphasiastrum complanatum]|uniref:Uncharacterized protein n=1 Tax=Diphasiastrum complanatum TaxID=34168 RepID=A0ACC2C3S0_DIPCM|nr:hypothetical protein O6H91_12G076000 [Diphasiastrum complanatum]